MSEGSETHVHVDVRKMLYCPLRLFTAQCLSALKAAEGRNVSKCIGSHGKSFQWILNSESYTFRTLCSVQASARLWLTRSYQKRVARDPELGELHVSDLLLGAGVGQTLARPKFQKTGSTRSCTRRATCFGPSVWVQASARLWLARSYPKRVARDPELGGLHVSDLLFGCRRRPDFGSPESEAPASHCYQQDPASMF